MNQSPDISTLAAALVKAQAALKPALKDGNNPHFRSSYATLQSVWDAARAALTPNGLAVIQTFSQSESGDVVHITTTLAHNSGQYVSGTLSLKPTKADPQGLGSAITYGRRYSLSAILGIVADDDDDGNAASVPVKPEPYKPTGPLASEASVKALSIFMGDGNKATKLQAAMDKKNILSFSDLSEADAQKLLKWISAQP